MLQFTLTMSISLKKTKFLIIVYTLLLYIIIGYPIYVAIIFKH